MSEIWVKEERESPGQRWGWGLGGTSTPSCRFRNHTNLSWLFWSTDPLVLVQSQWELRVGMWDPHRQPRQRPPRRHSVLLTRAHTLHVHSCMCVCTHTQARWNVGHWLEGLGAGGYEDPAIRIGHASRLDRYAPLPPSPCFPVRLACVCLTQRISRLLFGFP